MNDHEREELDDVDKELGEEFCEACSGSGVCPVCLGRWKTEMLSYICEACYKGQCAECRGRGVK